MPALAWNFRGKQLAPRVVTVAPPDPSNAASCPSALSSYALSGKLAEEFGDVIDAKPACQP